MGKKIGLVSIALIVFMVFLMAFVSIASAAPGDHSNVVNTVHNVTRGLPGANPCEGCHIPHDASGAFLWARNPHASGGGSSVGPSSTTAIKPLCYSCHDGTVAVTGMKTVFDPTKANHKTKAASTLITSGSQKGQPYGPGRDCDLCHNPHDDGNTDFLIYGRTGANGAHVTVTPGGNVCVACHAGNLDASLGGTGINHRTHIVPSAVSMPIDAIWNPFAGDYTGTRLFDPTTNLVSAKANAVLACESCHTPHGSITDENSLNTMAPAQLCINCHK
ncbi:MAG: cytochrome c3 family protein [Actinobacteria bacterium]|nr:cytochrome c3 family protein [Actinomycetota bacterium]